MCVSTLSGTVIGVVGGVFIVVGAVLMIASRAQKTDMSMVREPPRPQILRLRLLDS